MWRLSNGEHLRTLKGHTNEVTSAEVSPDSVYIVTASTDCTARMWRMSDGECLHTLQGHAGIVLSATFAVN